MGSFIEESGHDSCCVNALWTSCAVQLHMNAEPSFTRMKEISIIDNPAILLVEGYKEGHGEKVVLLRSEEDWQALQVVSEIQLVVGNVEIDVEYPMFRSRSAENLDEWFLKWAKENSDESV